MNNRFISSFLRFVCAVPFHVCCKKLVKKRPLVLYFQVNWVQIVNTHGELFLEPNQKPNANQPFTRPFVMIFLVTKLNITQTQVNQL